MILYYLQLWYYEINFRFSNRIFLSFLFHSSYIDAYSYAYLKKWSSLPSHGTTPSPCRSISTNTVVTHCFFYCSKYSYWSLLKISRTESPQDTCHYSSYESSVFFPRDVLSPHCHLYPGARIEHVVVGLTLSLWPKLLCITLACSD